MKVKLGGGENAKMCTMAKHLSCLLTIPLVSYTSCCTSFSSFPLFAAFLLEDDPRLEVAIQQGSYSHNYVHVKF